MKLYLSVGDPAGVGPELALRLLREFTRQAGKLKPKGLKGMYRVGKLLLPFFPFYERQEFPEGFLNTVKLFANGVLELHVVGNYGAMLYSANDLDKASNSAMFLRSFSYAKFLEELRRGNFANCFFRHVGDEEGDEVKAFESKKLHLEFVNLSTTRWEELQPKKYSPGKEAGMVAFKTLQLCCSLISAAISDVGSEKNGAGKDEKRRNTEKVEATLENVNEPVALVTLPIDKRSITKYLGTPFVGHTSFLSRKYCEDENAVSMAFSTPLFQMVLMTVHVPLKEVCTLLSKKKVGKKLIHTAITNALYLQKCFSDKAPLQVLGVNPHAGEDGLLGGEEELITDVLQAFRRQGHKIAGPLPADGFIRTVAANYYKKKRATILKPTIVSPYHDQGLVAAKMAAHNFNGVNISLGLPFVRTSVDHGTGYEVVGKNSANANSLFLAVHEAVRLMQFESK